MSTWNEFFNNVVGGIGQNVANNAAQGEANIQTQIVETGLLKSQVEHRNKIEQEQEQLKRYVLVGTGIILLVAVIGTIVVLLKK